MRTRDQRRADTAKRFATERESWPASKKEAFASMCRRMSVVVRRAGLTQALHLVEGRGEDGGPALLDELAAHLHTAGLLDGLATPGRRHLLTTARGADLVAYMRLTREVLGVLQWQQRSAAQSPPQAETLSDTA